MWKCICQAICGWGDIDAQSLPVEIQQTVLTLGRAGLVITSCWECPDNQLHSLGLSLPFFSPFCLWQSGRNEPRKQASLLLPASIPGDGHGSGTAEMFHGYSCPYRHLLLNLLPHHPIFLCSLPNSKRWHSYGHFLPMGGQICPKFPPPRGRGVWAQRRFKASAAGRCRACSPSENSAVLVQYLLGFSANSLFSQESVPPSLCRESQHTRQT